MKFGLWYDFRNPQRQRWPDLYAELLDQIEWADSAGFESVWLSEHHVTDDGYMSHQTIYKDKDRRNEAAALCADWFALGGSRLLSGNP